MTQEVKLRFVHLSDIHFNSRRAEFGFDPDRELRSAVSQDIADQCGVLGRADAILVSGDIAYSGKRVEFEEAARWLDEVCDAAGCGREKVLICPGNHDVDRSIIKTNQLIQDGHDAVRRGGTFYEKDSALTARLMQPDARALFYAPATAYNEFAARYQCSFFADAENYVWEHDFLLNDGSTLRVRGLNTALLSGLEDRKGKLFLGSRAWTLPKLKGVEYLVMAHHPPSWLADAREADNAFDGLAKIHLFGHEHDQRVTPGRDWIKLSAGSINPHRAEDSWCPGYNIIEVSVSSAEHRQLNVNVHARAWQGAPPRFRTIEDRDGDKVFRVGIKLPAYSPGASSTPSGLTPSALTDVVHKEVGEPMESTPPDPQLSFPLIVFRFFKLSLSKKSEIVGHFRLSEEVDSRLPDVERFKLALVRAKDRGQLIDLEKMITQLENN